MDVNCSGSTGLQPSAAAHFFCPVPSSTRLQPGHNPNNCSGFTGASQAAPG